MLILPSFGHLKNRSPNINAGKCINFYLCVNIPGKQKLTLMHTPGARFKVSTKNAECRGLHQWDRTFYIISGNTLYSWNLDGSSSTLLGTIGTDSGRVWLTHNANNELLVVDGDHGYVYNRSAGTFIQQAGYPSDISSCAFINQRAVFTYGDLGLVGYTDQNDFTTVNALSFFTAESNPDAARAIIELHGELGIFGDDSLEFYYDNGTGSFSRREGAKLDIGIMNAATVSQKNDLTFFLDSDGQVRLLQGYSTQIISDDNTAYLISTLNPENSKGFAFVQEGHIFYALIFETKCLVYDYTTSFRLGTPVWHERQSFPVATRGKWRANCCAQYKNRVFVGDHSNGRIYELDMGYYFDNANTIRREMPFQLVHGEDRVPFFHGSLEIEFESGVGLATGQGSNPQAFMSYSDDGGHTYSDEVWRSPGAIGKYQWTATWNSLGQSKNRQYVISMSDPVKWVIIAGHLKGAWGNA